MTRIADRVMKICDAEEANFQRQIASDPDAPEGTDEQLAKAKPFAEALPELAESIRKNLGGRLSPIILKGRREHSARSRSR